MKEEEWGGGWKKPSIPITALMCLCSEGRYSSVNIEKIHKRRRK